MFTGEKEENMRKKKEDREIRNKEKSEVRC